LKTNNKNLSYEFGQLNKLHPHDISTKLKNIHDKSKEDFCEAINLIPENIVGDVILELPSRLRDLSYEILSNKKLSKAIDNLQTDDATDIIIDIEDFDKNKANKIFDNLDENEKKDIELLKRYNENVAGSFMQTELFSATLSQTVSQAITKLKILKNNDELKNIHQIFIVDDNNKLIASILLDDLIICDFSITFAQIIKENSDKIVYFNVDEYADIQSVSQKFEDYDISVIAVLDKNKKLIGRITYDDIFDVVKQNATQQMYHLAGVNKELEYEDSMTNTIKKRSFWLSINLLTAILASLVIAIFDETIKEFIALAILMPIVASMGGNAGTQTLAVIVRQIALGEINPNNSKNVIKKELFVAIINGLFFAFALAIIAILWFDNTILGIIIFSSMIITILCSGFFGAIIPIFLKKMKIDPAIGSTVILTTITDTVGFFSFLVLAKIFLVTQ
jgi:magnesium transporter